MPTGLGDEQLWISATNDNTGASTALNDLSASSKAQYSGSGVTVAADTSEGGTYALSFNGASTRSWLYTPSLQTNGGYFGWSVWFKADAFNSAMSIAGGNSWSSHKGGLLLVDGSGNLILNLSKGTNGVPNVSINYAASLNTGQWYHAAATGDGTTARLYLDGVEVGSGAFTGFPTSWERFMRLGSAGAGSGDSGYGTDSLFFDGLIDDARFYDRTLTQTDITHLSSSRGVTGPSYSGLGGEQLWLSATNNNTGTSTAFQDQSGNGNDGTAIGTLVVADTSEGGSYAFDFSNASLQKISVGTLDLTGLSNFTWSAWIYDDSSNAASTHSTFFSWATNATQPDLLFYNYQRSKLAFQINDGADGGNEYAQVNFQNWHHYCVTFDGSNPVATDRLKYYLDGAVQTPSATFSYPATLGSTGTNMGAVIGAYVLNPSSIFYFNGRQDDIRAYDRTLTQSEITHLASQRGVEGPPPVGLGDEQLWLCPSLNDSANDISGSGNDGAYNGGMGTVLSDGKLAYDFDGTDDYIDCGAVFRPTGNFSISFWALNDTTARAMYVSKNWDGTSEGYVSRYDGGAGPLKFYTYSSGITYGTDVANPFTTSQWSCVTNVYNGTHWEIYIDGVLASQTAQTQPPYDSPSGLWIGATSVGGWNLNGRMDDIRMFDRALTQAEITHLASQRGVEGPPPVGLGDEKLWLCPSLNDSANDISGNGNDGTYNGGMGTVLSDGKLAYDFDGTDDHINCGNDSSLSFVDVSGDTEMSISAWVNLASYSNNANARGIGLLGKGATLGGSGTAEYSMICVDGKPNQTLYPNNSNGSAYLGCTASNAEVPLTTWKHVTFTYSGCETTGCTDIYVDGILVSSVDGINNYTGMADDGGDLEIGTTLRVAFSRWFYGQMDDIRAYNRVLTQSEITHLATSRGIEGSPSTSATVIASTSGPRSGTGQVGSAIDTTGADMIIMSISGYSGVATPSDSEGNTWVNLSTSGGSRKQRLSYCLSPTTSSSHTFSCTNTAFPSASVVAFSGVGSYESESFSADVSGTTVQAGAVTPTTDNSLVFIGAVNEGGIYNAVDSGFTLETAAAYVSGAAMGNAAAYLVQPLAASVDATLTCSVSTGKSASVAVFTTTGTPPVTPDVFFNPFQSKTFFPNYTRRIR